MLRSVGARSLFPSADPAQYLDSCRAFFSRLRRSLLPHRSSFRVQKPAPMVLVASLLDLSPDAHVPGKWHALRLPAYVPVQ